MTNFDEVFEIMVDRQIAADSFVYLGSNDADCADEVKLGTATGMAVIVKLTKMWQNKSVNSIPSRNCD